MTTVIASSPHYQSHLGPVDRLLPRDLDVTLVASYGDLNRARRQNQRRPTRIVLAQHGAGQSYSDNHASYPGGQNNEAVGMFLCPNEHSAGRWRAAYPRARVEVVGCPRLDDLPSRVPGPGPVIAVSTHWDDKHSPEGRSAWSYIQSSLRELAKRYTVIGHAHPRYRRQLDPIYRRHGIEVVPTFDEVCRRADVYIMDNSSTLFEFASTGRPVVVLDAPTYRKNVNHGLRFWDAADVGVRIPATGDLIAAVETALEDAPEVAARREAALDIVYAFRTGAAQRAADAILDYARLCPTCGRAA